MVLSGETKGKAMPDITVYYAEMRRQAAILIASMMQSLEILELELNINFKRKN